MRLFLSMALIAVFVGSCTVRADVAALKAKLHSLRARRIAYGGSKGINWQDSIFSEGSPDFVRPYRFALGDEVTLALQVFHDAPVKKVYLWSRPDNVERVEEMKPVGRKGRFLRFEKTIKVEQQRLHYYFIVASANRAYYYSQAGLSDIPPLSAFDFVLLAGYKRPDWCDDAVFYQIFTDRFYDGNKKNNVKTGQYEYGGFKTKARKWGLRPLEWNEGGCMDFYGGDLEGIRKKLSYLKKLGVNSLYLNPIFHAPSHHKFDCIDYKKVDPHFGGNKALADLTKACHQKGMYVVLDISVNHTGTTHRWFNREEWFGKKRGAYWQPEGKEGQLYLRKKPWDGKGDPFVRWFGVDSLVTLDYGRQETRNIIYENEDSVLKHWLKPPYSIDGWRFDVAFMMARYKDTNYQDEVWPAIRQACKEVNSVSYLVTEDWTDATEYLQGDMFDAAMNYFGLARPLRRWLGQVDRYVENKDCPPHRESARSLAQSLGQNLSRLPHALWGLQLNLIGSHDWFRVHTHKSFNLESYKGVVAVQFTFPGMPCIYYGDEVGLGGHVETTEGCRYPMEWDEKKWKHEFVDHYRTLAALKRNQRALKNGSYRQLYANGRLFAFARFAQEDIVVTVISDEKSYKTIRLPLALVGAKERQVFGDVFGIHKPVTVKGGFIELQLAPHQAIVLTKQ